MVDLHDLERDMEAKLSSLRAELAPKAPPPAAAPAPAARAPSAGKSSAALALVVLVAVVAVLLWARTRKVTA
jgi:ferric-dicitrate binding protein FerR (iron transport regulator)